MTRQNLLWLALILSIVIALLHFMVPELYSYWSISWFDILIHFGGGMVISLLGIWVIFYLYYFPSRIALGNRQILYIALSTAFIAGVGWEIFEFFTSLPSARNYVFDTTTNLLMNLLGALGAYTLIIYFTRRAVLD